MKTYRIYTVAFNRPQYPFNITINEAAGETLHHQISLNVSQWQRITKIEAVA